MYKVVQVSQKNFVSLEASLTASIEEGKELQTITEREGAKTTHAYSDSDDIAKPQ